MDWQAIIRDYSRRYRVNGGDLLDWFRRQPSLEAAIDSAARAVDDRGKRHSHQRRIPQRSIREGRCLLLDAAGEITARHSFHELWALLDRLLKPVHRLGVLYIYDTALRIGAYLRLSPGRVYLHRGTLIGAKKAGLISGSREWLEMNELPAPLRDLPVSEVEDILCIYKEGIGRTDRCAPSPVVRY